MKQIRCIVAAILAVALMGSSLSGCSPKEKVIAWSFAVPATAQELEVVISQQLNEQDVSNDDLTRLFAYCDAEGYIHFTIEGEAYITAKDQKRIYLSQVAPDYSSRTTQRTFQQMMDLSETYVKNKANMVYGNFQTPFNDTTTNEIDCSSFVQSILYGIPYETSRLQADQDIGKAKYDFGFQYPENPYRTEFGPKRYLANDIGHYAVDKGFAFYPKEDYSNIAPGDLLFFSTNIIHADYYMHITHVAICTEVGEDGKVTIVHGNNTDVVNYLTVDLDNPLTELGLKNSYYDTLVLIARYPLAG